jgi:hypothetical protein
MYRTPIGFNNTSPQNGNPHYGVCLPQSRSFKTAWEEKHDNPQYALYKAAINNGLVKLNKYYSWFDEKPSYILALGM